MYQIGTFPRSRTRLGKKSFSNKELIFKYITKQYSTLYISVESIPSTFLISDIENWNSESSHVKNGK